MKSTTSNKLIKVERIINVYSRITKESLEEINIDTIPFEILKTIVLPKDDDPLLYDGYVLNRHEIELFNLILAQKIIPDFESHNYILEVIGIYDWSTKE